MEFDKRWDSLTCPRALHDSAECWDIKEPCWPQEAPSLVVVSNVCACGATSSQPPILVLVGQVLPTKPLPPTNREQVHCYALAHINCRDQSVQGAVPTVRVCLLCHLEAKHQSSAAQ